MKVSILGMLALYGIAILLLRRLMHLIGYGNYVISKAFISVDLSRRTAIKQKILVIFESLGGSREFCILYQR